MEKERLRKISIFIGDGELYDRICPDNIRRIGTILYQVVPATSEDMVAPLAEAYEIQDTISND